MACRSASRANEAMASIKQKTDKERNVGELVFRHLELAYWASVRKCAKEILDAERSVDILVNNAGEWNQIEYTHVCTARITS